jgi:hypothetical protein
MRVEGKNLDDTPAKPLNFLKGHIGSEETIDLHGLNPVANFKARLAFMKRASAASASALSDFVKST